MDIHKAPGMAVKPDALAMDIKLFNTLSGSKETFKPLRPGHVGMYHCGPTVYDTPHLGNYRTFVMSDLLRRLFEYDGYAVDQVMNITDVDDKTIKRSREEDAPLDSVTRRYEKLFFDGLDSLNIKKPEHTLRATEHIGEMISLIKTLVKKGFAYKAEDGVYMSIDKVKDYGRLAHIDARGRPLERISNDEYDKADPRDFALWKFKTDDDHGVSWEAPFGEGRPGWHIECSAMSMEVLGPTIDIHTGGNDLIFPHHTNEIAQSESATGKPFVHYWVHGGFMSINAEKMAKSKKNIIKLEDLSEASVSPLAYRYWLLTGHYRSPMDFSYEAVKAAQNAYKRLLDAVAGYPEGGSVNAVYAERFGTFVNDDLDTPKAMALAWEMIKDPAISDADKRATLLDFDRIFGLKLDAPVKKENGSIPEEIRILINAREDARKAKDWKKADELRAKIESAGYSIKDTSAGTDISAV